MVQLQRVRPDRAPNRGLIVIAVVVLVALGGFIAGRQSGTPSVTTAPEASAGASTLPPALSPPALATPLVRPAVIPADLVSMAGNVLAQGSWAVCETRDAIRCERLPRIELTASEAAEARTAWPRLTPVTSSPGEVVVAAPSTALDYALFVSLDPGTRPTLVEPAIWSPGSPSSISGRISRRGDTWSWSPAPRARGATTPSRSPGSSSGGESPEGAEPAGEAHCVKVGRQVARRCGPGM